MSQKFCNKYRIPPSRMVTWDYSANGAYFITLCTAGKGHYFGDIRDCRDAINRVSTATTYVNLNEIGHIAEQYWNEIPQHFPFVELGEFVVMPNHIHGIIIINKKNHTNSHDRPVETPYQGVSIEQLSCFDGMNDISQNLKPFCHDISNQHNENGGKTCKPYNETPNSAILRGGKNSKWKSGTIGVIINQFKRKCTIEMRKMHADFAWQSRFYDHIIRSNISYNFISNYIQQNPENWQKDKFYKS
ncbi:MAG: hypothetical protein PF481_11155 [Bacteroidales bacterium]|jgi:putative transposase|nr:hypothetical protein [Bacteroidales bacterium]